MNLAIGQQQSCIQLTLHTITMILDVNSAFSPGQFVLNFCSTATRLQCRRRKSRRYAALPFLVRYTNRPRVHQRRYTKRTSWRVSLCRGVGGRVGVHTGHHLDGALLRHLPAADVAALADPPARLPHHRCRVARRPGRHDADRRLPAPAAHAHRRPQVRRDLGRPLPRKGSRCLPDCSPNDPTACVLRAAVTCGLCWNGWGVGLAIQWSPVRVPVVTLSCNNLTGQVVRTHVPLSPSSILWYRSRGGDAVRLGR